MIEPRLGAGRDGGSAFIGRRYHFVGVGGIGMSSLARLLLSWGAAVSGSDRSESEMLAILRTEGADVCVGHNAGAITSRPQPDFVVYSKAIPTDNPELSMARNLGIPTMHRAELLNHMMADHRSVCICGTHGKTTTTAMLAVILIDAGMDPSVMLGGMYAPIGGNERSGHGEVFVAEACEAYGSFLSLHPDLAVVTNIEADHLDENTTFDSIRESFHSFLSRVPDDGLIAACIDSVEVCRLLPRLIAPVRTFGLEGSGAEWQAQRSNDGSWDVQIHGRAVAHLALQVPGVHNVVNALGALAIAEALGVSPWDAAESLHLFEGVERRFSIRGVSGGILVVDDYAHHPSEIRVTLRAARALLPEWTTVSFSDVGANPGRRTSPVNQGCGGGTQSSTPRLDRRLIAVFQPHLFSRTAAFMDEFVESFEDADIVLITEIYAARENPIAGINGCALADRLRNRWPGKGVQMVQHLRSLPERVAAISRPGDIVLALGAGNITNSVPEILQLLKTGSVHT